MKALKSKAQNEICAAVILAVIAAIPILPALIFGAGIGPFDAIHQLPPWHTGIDKGWNVLQADAVLQFYPWRMMVLHAWQHLHIPWWNPYILNGTPLLANSQSGALYPFHILFGLLHIPVLYAIGWLAWLHLFIAGLGMKAFVEIKKGSKPAGVIAGGLFALSPFMLGWVPLPSVIETFAWAPWLLYFVVSIRQKIFHQESIVKINLSCFGLGLAVGMTLLAGHLQFAVYSILGTILFFLVEFYTGIRSQGDSPPKAHIKISLYFAAAIALGFFFAAPQLIPVVNLGKQSHRQTNANSSNYASFISGADQPYILGSVAASELLGLPDSSFQGPKGNLVGYWPAFVTNGSNFSESAISIGIVSVFFICLGFRKREWQKSISLVVLSAFGLLLAFGTPLNMVLYYLIPGWADTGSPGRAGCLFVLAAIAIAGLSIDQAIKAGPKQIFLQGLLPCLILIALPFNFYVSFIHSHLSDALASVLISSIIGHLWIPAVALGNVILGLLLFTRFNKLGALIFLSLIGSIVFSIGLVPLSTNTDFSLPAIEADFNKAQRVAVIYQDWQLLTLPDQILPPNLLAIDGINQVGGYDSLIRKEARNRLADVDGEDPAPPANGNMMFVKPGFDPQALANLGVTEVISGKAALSPDLLLEKKLPNDAGFIYKLQGPGRASLSNGKSITSVSDISQDASSVTVHVDGPGRLTLRDDLGLDWKAIVNGRLANITRSPWPTAQVPAGPQTVRFYSSAAVFTLWFWLLDWSAVLAIFLLILLAGSFFKRQELQETEKSLQDNNQSALSEPSIMS